MFEVDLLWMNMAALAFALFLDIAFGDPPNIAHPVAYMGKLIALLERISPKTNRLAQLVYGFLMALIIPAIAAAGGYFLSLAVRDLHPTVYIAVMGTALKLCFSVRGLGISALSVKHELARNDIKYRKSLTALVSRDTSNLSPTQVASAAVESVAENTTDSFVAPWLYFALLGLPGVLAYRAINTLDSMIGYRGKYEYLGKVSACVDDILNFIPARLSALIIVVVSRFRQFNSRRALHLVFSEGHSTSSPNAGLTMAAMAGALGITLEKVGYYCLGSGLRKPEYEDIEDSVKVMYLVAATVFILIEIAMMVVYVAV